MNLLRRCLACLSLLLLASPFAHAKPKPAPDHWVATWATANYANQPSTKPGAFVPGSADVTLRQVVHASIGGSLVRIEFTNVFGTEPLILGQVHIALADPKTGITTGDIALVTANALTFGGASSITIPAGAEAVSDPVALTLPSEGDLVVSTFLPAQKISVISSQPGAFQTNFYAPGNHVGERSLSADGVLPQVVPSWFFIKSVDVQGPASTGTIVAFGDSITEGYASTINTNQRWPDDLGRRLQADPQQGHLLGVVDEGIGGNRILNNGNAQSALVRFDRDVLSIPGVRSVIVLEGINDIGVGYGPQNPHDTVTADELIAGLTQLAARAHAHNIKIFGGTVLPYIGANYSSAAGDQVRQDLNTWIRTTNVFDGFIDFAKATESATTPNTLSPAYDCGDHLHPTNAGMKAMADAVNLLLLR